MAENSLTKDYFFFNLLEIVEDSFPEKHTFEMRMLLNSVLSANKRSLIDTDEEFLKELYG